MLYRIAWVLTRILVFPIFRVKVEGKENLPKDRPYIICANHWSNMDPVLIGGAVGKPIYFMAKKELFSSKIIGGLLKSLHAFPVDREKMDMKSLRRSVELIKDEKIIGIFPEGKRVYEMDRSNMKEGAAYVAIKTEADVVPVEIISKYRPFSKTKITFKEPLYIDNYKKSKRKIAMAKLSNDTFDAMYEERIGSNLEKNE